MAELDCQLHVNTLIHSILKKKISEIEIAYKLNYKQRQVSVFQLTGVYIYWEQIFKKMEKFYEYFDKYNKWDNKIYEWKIICWHEISWHQIPSESFDFSTKISCQANITV
jgi:hypothetical protein